jgi:hypothetical protein
LQYIAYYIIRPNPAFKELIRNADNNLGNLEDLLSPQLWTHAQGGRSSLTLADRVSEVKRLSVACVRYLVLASMTPSPPLVDLPVQETTFDRWWTLEVFDGEDASTDLVAHDLRMLDRPELVELLSGFAELEIEY